MQMGNEAEALQVYEELMSRPGLTGRDFYAIGVGFYQASDYEQAVRAFAGAADVAPQDRDALEMWARSLQLSEAFADVPPVAQRWIALDPSSRNAYLILAQASNSNGDQTTTQEAVQAVDELMVNVDQLQLRRTAGGGGSVTGQVVNLTMDQGSEVTLRFTFYGSSGSPIGSVTQSVTVGAENMAEIFEAVFSSTEEIDGYGYEIVG